MALTEFEIQRYKFLTEEFIEAIRPKEEIRDQLDINYSLKDQSIIIFEVRPAWDDSGEVMKNEVVKLTYVKTTDSWKLFWMRSDLKWHSYDPDPEVETLQEGLQIVKADKMGYFWG